MPSTKILEFRSGFVILILLFLSPSVVCAQDSENQSSSNLLYPEATIWGTESRSFHSDIIDQDFELSISLPQDYFRSDTVYPVLYALDANIGFGITSNIVRILSTLHKEIPEMLVVGIGYQTRGLEDWVAWRIRDLSPTHDPESDEYWLMRLAKATGRFDIVVRSGGAPKFLECIRDELIPFIESNYRVSSTDRTLQGHSRGGLFALYVLFHQPDTFKRYLISSPSNQWDNNILFKYEKEYSENNNDLDARVFMSFGSFEDSRSIENMHKMKKLLLSRGYPMFELETHIFEGENHGSVSPCAYSRGLRELFY
jgi:predicted alpha/beta superfamily hydrolase